MFLSDNGYKSIMTLSVHCQHLYILYLCYLQKVMKEKV